MRHLVLGTFAVLLSGASLASAPPPRVRAQSIDQLAQPLPLPYDEKADAHAQLAAAVKLANSRHKLLLLDLGGNWCPDCRVLAGILALPEVKAFIDRHYVVLSIDIGRYDKNLDIADRFGAHYEKGAPAILAVDPRTGRLVNGGHTLALRDARHMTPQALADWLAQWT